MSRFCPHCGTARSAGDVFCGGCGVHFQDRVEHCPTCGQTLPPGTRLQGAPAPGVPAAPAVAPAFAPAVPAAPPQPSTISSPPGLIYGPDFNAAADCWNCGNADVPRGTPCPLCKHVRV